MLKIQPKEPMFNKMNMGSLFYLDFDNYIGARFSFSALISGIIT
jgi:hypothetical protein